MVLSWPVVITVNWLRVTGIVFQHCMRVCSPDDDRSSVSGRHAVPTFPVSRNGWRRHGRHRLQADAGSCIIVKSLTAMAGGQGAMLNYARLAWLVNCHHVCVVYCKYDCTCRGISLRAVTGARSLSATELGAEKYRVERWWTLPDDVLLKLGEKRLANTRICVSRVSVFESGGLDLVSVNNYMTCCSFFKSCSLGK